MKTKASSLAARLALAAAALAISSGAFAEDAKTPERAPKTIVLVIPPMAMIPDSDNAATTEYFNGWSSGLTSENECFNTGVTLPEGAEIQNLRIYFKSTAGSMFIDFRQQDPNLTQSKSLISFQTTDTSGNVASQVQTPAVKPVVDARKFGYGLGVCIDTGQTFLGAKITYKPAP